MPVEFLNPEALEQSPYYAQGAIASGRMLYVGGQNGVTEDGVMLDGAIEQTKQALRNVLAVLAEGGAAQDDVAMMTVHLAAEVDPNATYPAVVEVWGRHPTPVSVISVVRLGRPGALVEVSAVAAV